MPETETETPTDEERARFFIERSVGIIGWMDTIEEGLGNAYGTDNAGSFVRNLEVSFFEGAQRVMRNKREIGYSPMSAWNYVVDDDWPRWVKASLAQQEYDTFGGSGRDPEFMSDEEENYLTELEQEYDVV